MPLSFLFPPICLGCRRLLQDRRGPELPLCAACGPDLGLLTPDQRRLGAIDACFSYEGPLARAATRLKFDGELDLAGPLGRLLAAAPIWREGWDLVAPVPLHWRRALARGFNQSALLAERALRGAPGPRLDLRLLRRSRATAPQSELDAGARRGNVAAAFALRRGRQVRGLRVLVVDDITTTGATLQACLDPIRAAGAARAAGLALLRTPL